MDDFDNIAAVIDWQFAYAAATQFVLDPPWWLLLESAETWSSSIDNWKQACDLRLKTWSLAMERAEESMNDSGPFPVTLSTHIEESWERGRFWLNLA